MGGAVATHGDDQPIAGGRRGVGSITSAAGLDHLDLESGDGARSGAPFPETTSAAAARRRIDDDQWDQICGAPASPLIWPVSI